MPLNIRNDEVSRLVGELADVAQVSKTEAVRLAVANELARRNRRMPLAERLQPLFDRVAAVPDTGLPTDKAFYDSLNDE